jgi:predicted nucleic acid-binding protein
VTRFLLDRDVLGAAENPRGNRYVHAWLAGVPDGDLYVSVITVMEARKGFSRMRTKAVRPAEIEVIRGYETDFDALLAAYEGRILVIDRAVADIWGEMLGRREAHVMDTALAATAGAHRLVVATRNVRHFRDRGVRVLDPFKANPAIEEPDERPADGEGI